MTPSFRPGVELCRDFYRHAVAPLLAEAYPSLPYAAARIGPGSDVLGYDSARSVDHDWGPRLELLLAPEDRSRYGAALHQLLSDQLPRHFDSWSTHFLPAEGPVRSMAEADGPLAHRVHISDLPTWCAEHLGVAPTAELTTLDWLATPGQRLAEATGGEVYHDDTGTCAGCGDGCAPTPPTYCATCWPVSGHGWVRRNRSSVGPPKPATSWAAGSSPPAWPVT